MRALTIEDLTAASYVGGASSLVMRQELEPASGPDGVVAPAKYTDGSQSTYVYEKRYSVAKGEPENVVLIDSKSSFANRAEETTTQAMRDAAKKTTDNNGDIPSLLSKMPHITVEYDIEAGKRAFYDNQLPHRGFDGHIRVGIYEGESASKAEAYVKARNSTLENLLPLFELSPETVIFGGWDSTRSKNQLRIPSILVGETYGILADQESDPLKEDCIAIHRAGGRVDPVGASIKFADKDFKKAIIDSGLDLSEKLKDGFLRKGEGSKLGLGAIPPMIRGKNGEVLLDGVSVRKVISTRVLSFATVRTFHFGKGVEGDAAIRALIIAVLLRDIAGYDDNPFIRANCFLSETGKPTVVLNKRYGEKEELEPLTVDVTEKLLEAAYAWAHEKAGITWEGQEFLVQGNPMVLANASAEDDDKEN